MQPCTVYRERELVRRREEKEKGGRREGKFWVFFKAGGAGLR